MAKHSKGKHAAPAADKKKAPAPGEPPAAAERAEEAAPGKPDAAPAAGEAAEVPAAAKAEPAAAAPAQPAGADGAAAAQEAAPPGRRGRTIAIVAGCVVGLLAIIYLGGVLLFSGHYLPRTYVAGTDFSLKTPEEMAQTLDETLDGYRFSVVGKGMNFTVTSADASLSSDSDQVAADVLDAEDPWAWPIEVFESRDLTDVFTHAISANGLSDIVDARLEELNATAKQPVNATIAFDEAAAAFVPVEEVKGTAIDGDKLLEAIISGLMRFDDRVVLTDEVLVEPTIFVDDPRIARAAEQANGLIRADFDLIMAGNLVSSVDPALIAGWVSVGPELEVALDEAALTGWATEVSGACNTVGSRRTYTRPDGKEASVAGGTYGWKVDNGALVEQVVAAVKAGSHDDIAIPVLQEGTGFTGLGGQDWGARYVDVDLSEQYARFYDGGSIIWESPIVSGNPNRGNSTPQGVWSMNAKTSPQVLIGQMQSDGTPEYETHVQYWMPFKGNSVGFHDATWQSSFGGSRYLSHGSHGCVNLPYSAAQSLYGIIARGDVVVVHK